MKRYSYLYLACLLLVISGCNHSPDNTEKKVFRLNLSAGYLESMDPAFAKDLYMMWIDHMLYNTLVAADEHMRIVPSLARSWQVSNDGLTYIFHLRGDVYFHDAPIFKGARGRRLTAADAVYSFDRIIAAATASPGAWIFNGRVSADGPFIAIDDTTLQIRLSVPFAPLPELLSMSYCSIVPHEAIEHWGRDFRNHPCGTGPFSFSYWDEGNALCLIKNKHYWEQDSAGIHLPYLDAVQVSFTDSKATEFQLFLQGKIDFINGIDGSFKDMLLTKKGVLKASFRNRFRMVKSTYLNTEYIGFLTDTSKAAMQGQPTRNVLVRRAINYAIDRDKIVTYFKNGMGIPATKGFIPCGMPGYDSAAGYGYNYDPAKASELLAEAGYPGGRGLAPLTILAQDNYTDIVNYVAGELQSIGITTHIEVMQPNILRQQMSRGEAVAFRAQWVADYPDAETYLVVFNSNFPAPPNYTRFANDTFNKWYKQGLALPDTARWKLYRRMDSLAVSYAPLAPLYYDEMLHFLQNNITGFTSNPMNIIDIKRVNKISAATP